VDRKERSGAGAGGGRCLIETSRQPAHFLIQGKTRLALLMVLRHRRAFSVRRDAMNTWFTSPRGALTLSAIAFVGGLAQLILIVGFVSQFARFVREDQPGQVALVILFFLGFYGGWVWALMAAARGSRGGLIGALIFSLVLALLWSLPNIVVFCPAAPFGSGCAAWPVGDIIQWAGLVVGLAASAALGLQLRRR
jgi:hypothetical protein